MIVKKQDSQLQEDHWVDQNEAKEKMNQTFHLAEK